MVGVALRQTLMVDGSLASDVRPGLHTVSACNFEHVAADCSHIVPVVDRKAYSSDDRRLGIDLAASLHAAGSMA